MVSSRTMNRVNDLRLQLNLMQEISQKSELKNALLHGIICSKRLLADHVDALEQCQPIELEQCYGDSIAETGRKFTFVKTLVSGTMAAATFITKSDCLKIVVPMAAATYSICYFMKSMFACKNMLMQYKINGIIDSIDSIDSAIRKNISYFRECEILSSAETAIGRNRERTMRCLNVIIEVNSLIYNEIKHLETIHLPSRVEDYYESLQELNDCVYFQNELTEATSSDIKNVYNIFLYFQSQFFFRLILLILNADDIGIKYLKTCQLSKLIANNVHILLVALNVDERKLPSDRTVDKLRSANQTDSDPVDLLNMKRSSMDIMSRLIAITNQYKRTDEIIQMFKMKRIANSDDALKLLKQMHNNKQALATCEDDYQRLILIFSKLIANKFKIKPKHLDIDEEKTKEFSDDAGEEKMVKNTPNETENMEFFAMRGIQNSDNSDSESMDGEKPSKLKRFRAEDGIDEFDLKITRSMFDPILKQLKDKIEPINTKMKERELKFLLAAGMDQETISEFNKNYETPEASALDPFAESSNRFDEMRSFLQQKQQVTFMQPFIPPTNCNEDILE